MRLGASFFIVCFGLIGILPAFAQGTEVMVSITGGGEAGQACVSAKNCYDPSPLTIKPETTVAWTNTDNTAHTVTSGRPSGNDTGSVFDSGEIGPDGTYSFIFMSPGAYDYYCTLHPWMTGQVIVSPPLSASNTNTAASNTTTIPEFGPTAAVVFAISIITVVLVAKNGLTLHFKYRTNAQ